MDTYSIRQFENCVNIKKVLMAVGKKRKKEVSSIPRTFCMIGGRRQFFRHE